MTTTIHMCPLTDCRTTGVPVQFQNQSKIPEWLHSIRISPLLQNRSTFQNLYQVSESLCSFRIDLLFRICVAYMCHRRSVVYMKCTKTTQQMLQSGPKMFRDRTEAMLDQRGPTWTCTNTNRNFKQEDSQNQTSHHHGRHP